MGTAFLIIVEIVGWGAAVVLIGGLLEAGWARMRRRSKQTVL